MDITKLKQIKVECGYQIVIEVQTKGNLVLILDQQLLEGQGTTELLLSFPCPQAQESWLWKYALSLKSH